MYRNLICSLQRLSPSVALDLCQAPVTVFLKFGLSIPFHVPRISTMYCLGRIATPAVG